MGSDTKFLDWDLVNQDYFRVDLYDVLKFIYEWHRFAVKLVVSSYVYLTVTNQGFSVTMFNMVWLQYLTDLEKKYYLKPFFSCFILFENYTLTTGGYH